MLLHRLRSILRRHLRARRRIQPVDRSIALQDEVEFWKEVFETGGGGFPQDFRERFNPDRPIQEHVSTYIDRIHTDPVHILDVGSGPLTKLGKKHHSKQLIITATDVLANEYDQLMKGLGIEPLVRTIHADAETLSEQFGRNSYDIVHGQNSVDHTSDPIRAIDQMLAVCKPFGFVVLFHHEDEGRKVGYRTLHQWDFTCVGGCFVIRDRHGRETNMTERLAAQAEVECTRLPDGDEYAILTGIRKRTASGWGESSASGA
jgi:SAM-dependent methyltransferase